jgi:hypothetical protein
VRFKTPGPPVGVDAVGLDASIAVTWNPPASDGGTSITAYTVTAQPGSETCTTTGATTCTVDGLVPGARYSVSVRASNVVGAGRLSRRSMATPTESRPESLDNAYLFLDQMMDMYTSGSTLRLVQSFTGGLLHGYTDSVTYDDALIIDALLARGTADDLARAQVIGNALMYVQANDPAHDGRIRAAYGPGPLTGPGAVVTTDATSDVGNMAWVGQALMQLYASTNDVAYLDGATGIATWIQDNTYDTRGSGGYTGGITANGSKISWKSTEHNIDVYALFTMLAAASEDPIWSTRAAWAQQFVESMWDSSQGRFSVGTLDDGVTVNDAEQPEDVNSWSYLALENPAYATSVDWDVHNLAVNTKAFSGVSFCLGDRSGVWFEGTAHLADALETRNGAGDQTQADAYLGGIAYAQLDGKNANGLGIIAASKNGLRDCDGGEYFASLHTGATAWYLLALQNANPFHLLG